MVTPRRLLAERGLAPHKGRGQNFLSDPNAARAIIRRAELDPGLPVLEIGPGLGALTRPLLESGFQVTAVEVDAGLAQYLDEELQPLFPGSFRLIVDDFLKVDLGGLVAAAGGKVSVLGNLPYLLSTPILFKLLENRRGVAKAALMFQTELAARLTAGPGGKDYGRLSVMLGYFAEIGPLMNLGADLFYPRPKVGSTVVGLVFKTDPAPPLDSPAMFERVTAAGFARRRKTLKNSLCSAFPPSEVDQVLALSGLDPGRRAETLSVSEFVQLANCWVAAFGKPS
ncbi:MAG: 16S rRNA (adenine(1518)-N(6)/adenine(1519)-N(6))-dimethyltransferase RsmA [Pseudomonadota bacterium]